VATNISDKTEGLCETVWVAVKTEYNREVTIGVCYRSPSEDQQYEENLMKEVTQFSVGEALIMGDFNHGDIDWNNLQAEKLNSRYFMNKVQDLFLTQHVEEPTRSDKVLDLVMSTEQDMIEDLQVLNPMANSDHCMIQWQFRLNTKAQVDDRNRYNFHKGRYDKICVELQEIDWDLEFEGKDVEGMWKILLTRLDQCRDKYVPKCKKRKEGHPSWMGASIRKKIKRREMVWKRFKQRPTFEGEMRYKMIRNSIIKEIRDAKKEQEFKLAEKIKEDPKSFYAYVRSKTSVKVKVGPLMEEGKLVSDSEGMSRVLNHYFSAVFTIEDRCNMPKGSGQGVIDGLERLEITEEHVIQSIKALKENKAPGVDGLNSTFIKGCMGGVVRPLVLVFNKSLTTGQVPQDWKDANVSALFKKGSRKEPGNYRPVSLTSQICKLLEKVIKEAMVSYLEGNGLIGNSQHGFRKGRSCLTNLLEFMQELTEGVDQGDDIDVIYLDFQKAFDKVPHRRLLLKLRDMGIGGEIAQWIENWLDGRKQRVVLNGYSSDWVHVTSGVPQGSVLGPVLFVAYINDLDEGIKNKIWKFADDTKLMGKTTEPKGIEELQEDLARLISWSEKWQMVFNVDKCKVMHIGKKNSGAKYMMGNKEIMEVQEEKDLGVIVCQNLKVAKQCGQAAKKGNQILGMIARAFVSRNKFIIMKLYKSLVRPHLDYCIQVWRPHLGKDIELLERVQRRMTRMVEGCKDLSYEKRLRMLGLTTLETRRVRADLIEVYKIFKGLDRVDENSFFLRSRKGYDYHSAGCTRGNMFKLQKRRFRLDVVKYSFGHRVVNEWNRLPDRIVRIEDLGNFKGELDKYLGHTRGFT
jgi:ribonuclease P/MRP protein subunit RPP40